jgi:hypothetical protein
MPPHGSRYFRHTEPERRWPSFVISLGVTIASFVAAFAAMTARSVGPNSDRAQSRDATLIFHLPVPVRPAPVTGRPPIALPERPARTAVPSRVAPPPVPSAPVVRVTPSASPFREPAVDKPSAEHDSVAAPSNVAIDSSSGRPERDLSKGKGAPFAPAGLTAGSRALNSAFVRDSIVRQSMRAVPGRVRFGVMGDADGRELEASQQQARQLQQRTLTAGNSRDLVVLQGKGKDGVGAVGGPGVGTISAPLFSSGPSAAQRKKNEKIDADNRLRLARLQDRLRLQRDSTLADSVRADSLRRDSVASHQRHPQ